MGGSTFPIEADRYSWILERALAARRRLGIYAFRLGKGGAALGKEDTPMGQTPRRKDGTFSPETPSLIQVTFHVRYYVLGELMDLPFITPST